MGLPRFEYHEPRTVEQACALLAQPGARALAGGTELLVKLKQRTTAANALVNLKSIPGLDRIEETEDGGLSIGPTATLRAVAASPLVRERYGLLAVAAASVGKPRIPEMATIGGNVCLDSRCFYYNQSDLWKRSVHACFKDGGAVCHVVKGSDHCNALFVADSVPALIALGAQVTLTDADIELQMPLEDFYTGTGEQVNALRPGRVLTQIRVPAPAPHSGGVYMKHSTREAIDFAVLGVAVLVARSPAEGTCHDVRVVLGSVATGPVRAAEVEAALHGRRIDEKSAKSAAALATKAVHPVNHLGVSATYKRKMIAVLTERAVLGAWQQAVAADGGRSQERPEEV